MGIKKIWSRERKLNYEVDITLTKSKVIYGTSVGRVMIRLSRKTKIDIKIVETLKKDSSVGKDLGLIYREVV